MRICNAVFFGIAFVIWGCGHTTKEAPRKKMFGINGEAIYVFNKGDTVAAVYKKEYFGSEFQVDINEDTVLLGSDFVSHLNVPHSNFEITITDPTNQIILEDSTYGSKDYRFKPDSVGTYDFRGIIKYDTVKTPFAYKFIVVKKHQ